jgi:2-C-methyl-D-erythritol 4-phosphate cytidylyltransferase
VRNALAMVQTSVVAIHDAARPLITTASIIDLLAALGADPQSDAVIAAAPVADTIKRAKGPTAVSTDSGSCGPDLIVDSTLDRSGLWSAQTPQVFRVKALRDALADGAQRSGIATDEAMLVEAAGGRVLIHPSIAPNLKVTTPLDLMIAEKVLLGRASS